MAIRDLQAVVYTMDNGEEFQTAQDAALFAQGKTGGADYTGAPPLDPLPSQVKPRGVYVGNGTNRRFVVCLTPAATLFTGAATTVDLAQIGVALPATYTKIRSKSERDNRRFRNPAG